MRPSDHTSTKQRSDGDDATPIDLRSYSTEDVSDEKTDTRPSHKMVDIMKLPKKQSSTTQHASKNNMSNAESQDWPETYTSEPKQQKKTKPSKPVKKSKGGFFGKKKANSQATEQQMSLFENAGDIQNEQNYSSEQAIQTKNDAKHQDKHPVSKHYQHSPGMQSLQGNQTPNDNVYHSNPPLSPEEELVQRTEQQLEQARTRQMNYLTKRREIKKRKLFWNRIKHTTRNVYLYLVIGTLWLLLQNPIWLYNAPNFNLNIQPNTSGLPSLITEKNLTPLLSQYTGKPLYLLNPKTIEEHIRSQYNMIDDISVRRSLLPTRLDIHILEKAPYAQVFASTNDTAPYALLTKDNQLIPLSLYQYNPDKFISNKTNAPITSIILPNSVELSDQELNWLRNITYKSSQVQGLHFNAVSIVQQLSKAKHEKHLSLDFDETTVLLGRLDAASGKRLDRLPLIANEVLKHQNSMSWVDLRWSEQVTFHKGKPKPASSNSKKGTYTSNSAAKEMKKKTVAPKTKPVSTTTLNTVKKAVKPSPSSSSVHPVREPAISLPQNPAPKASGSKPTHQAPPIPPAASQ